MSQEQDKPLEELRVVLMGDHAMFRAEVRHEIGKLCQMVGEGHDVASSVATILGTRPDAVLLGAHLPDGGGAEVIKQMVVKAPDVRFLTLSVSDAAEDVIGAIRTDARGYVTKSISSEELVEDIQQAISGDAVFSPRLASFVLDTFSGAVGISGIGEELGRLGSREREVLKLIARGYSYRGVARELLIPIKTMETRVSSVPRKPQLSNRRQLTGWVMDRHLV